MSDEETIGKWYRQHAEELRTIAECDRNKFTHETLLRIAADYEQMAETMDALEKTNNERRTRYRRS